MYFYIINTFLLDKTRKMWGKSIKLVAIKMIGSFRQHEWNGYFVVAKIFRYTDGWPNPQTSISIFVLKIGWEVNANPPNTSFDKMCFLRWNTDQVRLMTRYRQKCIVTYNIKHVIFIHINIDSNIKGKQ